MKIKKMPDSEGVWMGGDGQRCSLLVVRRMRDVKGVNVGYVEFPSLDEALAAWGRHLDALERKDEPAE